MKINEIFDTNEETVDENCGKIIKGKRHGKKKKNKKKKSKKKGR
jgi:hypothetical protein